MSYTTLFTGNIQCPTITTVASYVTISTDTLAENTTGHGVILANKLTTASNASIILTPNGTGDVQVLNSGVNDTVTFEDYTGSLGLTKSNIVKVGVSNTNYGYLKYYFNNDTTNSFEIGESAGFAKINMTRSGITTITGTIQVPSVITGTIATGGFLGLDASGNIVKNASSMEQKYNDLASEVMKMKQALETLTKH